MCDCSHLLEGAKVRELELGNCCVFLWTWRLSLFHGADHRSPGRAELPLVRLVSVQCIGLCVVLIKEPI